MLRLELVGSGPGRPTAGSEAGLRLHVTGLLLPRPRSVTKASDHEFR